MKILFIGDIFGEVGIVAIEQELIGLIDKFNIDYVIANAENTSSGRGLTLGDYTRLTNAGVQFMTMGNHTWHKKEIENILKTKDNIIRPYNIDKNFPESSIGIGTKEIVIKGKKVRITNLIGSSIEFKLKQTNPFLAMDEIILNSESDIHIVDFHAETTSEKNAFFLNFKGKVDAIVGTHTHVQTNDAKIYENTAYITDIGMTGAALGVIGANPKTIIAKFRDESQFFRLEPEVGFYQFSAVIIDFDDLTNKPKSIDNVLIYQK